jgi:hypothetical protein
MPLVLELTKRVAARIETAAAAGESSNSPPSSPGAAAAGGAGGGGELFDVSDAAKRITSDVMGQMLLGEDLQGTQWRWVHCVAALHEFLHCGLTSSLLCRSEPIWCAWLPGQLMYARQSATAAAAAAAPPQA